MWKTAMKVKWDRLTGYALGLIIWTTIGKLWIMPDWSILEILTLFIKSLLWWVC